MHQWAVAAIMTLLPLLVAIGYAIHSIEQQNRGQYRLVNTVILVNQLSVKVAEEVRELERFAKQYVVLADVRFAELYQNKEQMVRSRLNKLDKAIGKPELSQTVLMVFNLIDSSRVFPSIHRPMTAEYPGSETNSADPVEYRVVASPKIGPPEVAIADSDGKAKKSREEEAREQQLNQLEAVFDDVNKQIWTLESLTEQFIDDSLKLTEREYAEKRRYIWWIGSLILPLSGLLMLLFSYRISRPLKQLGSSIKSLGQGDLEQPIEIGGSRDLVLLGDRLEWTRLRLLSLEKQKNVFLRHVTHELKTPLSSIIEATSLLSDQVPGPINARQQQVLTILASNADKLLEQIQQLLNYNTVRSEQVEITANLDIQTLVYRQIERVKDLTEASQITFECKGGHLAIMSESARIEMVLSNLISNAINYSKHGGTIFIAWQGNRKEVGISVKDQGPGIAKAEQDMIFQPFYQGGALREGAIKGSGLGLSIVRECVNALHGRIVVESEPGKGANFMVFLPRNLDHPLAPGDLALPGSSQKNSDSES